MGILPLSYRTNQSFSADRACFDERPHRIHGVFCSIKMDDRMIVYDAVLVLVLVLVLALRLRALVLVLVSRVITTE